MKRRIVTGLAIAAALIVAGALALRAQRPVPAPPAAAAKAEAAVELATTDVVRAQQAELSQGLAITGTLKAVNSAIVKARVAGELQGLTVREGDAVRAGQVIATIDPTEYRARLQQAREQAESAAAQVQIAQRQFDNNKALVDQGFISRTALESSQSSLAAAQSTHKAALAAADVASKTLDDTALRAPITGVVAQRLAQPGERLGIDARVVEIVDPGRLELETMLTAAESVQVRVGQLARLSIEGLDTPVAAAVARINPSAQAGSRGVPVYLTVTPAPGLRQGLFAQGRLATRQASAVAVPLSALRTDKPAPYLQLVEGERVLHKTVQPGERGELGGQTLVAVEGVAAGTTVLLGHVGALREGSPVRFTGTAAAARAAP